MGAEREGPDQQRAASEAEPRCILVRELLRDAREVILDHDGQIYRLRVTLAGKLILTK